MAVSDGTALPPGLVRQAFVGLVNDNPQQAFADTACREVPVTDTDGNATIIPSVSTLPRNHDTGLPEGATPETRSTKGIKLPYSLLRYMGISSITAGDKQDFTSRGYDAAQEELALAWQEANTKLDLRLEKVLEDTESNETFDVDGDGGGQWNTATNNPFGDIRTVLREVCPGADTVIYGRKIRDTLAQNSNFIAESSQFDAGAIGEDEVSQMIVNKIGDITRALFFDSFYELAPDKDGLGDERQHIFDTGLWVGYGDHLAKFEMRGSELESPRLITDEDKLAEVEYYGVVRRCDIRRGDEAKGVTFTNILNG